jgi:hypothetical protein
LLKLVDIKRPRRLFSMKQTQTHSRRRNIAPRLTLSECVIDLSNEAPNNAGEGWTFDNGRNTYTILNNANINLIGTSTNSRRIVIKAGAKTNITLCNVVIAELADNQSPLLLKADASVTLTLAGKNFLAAGWDAAGIQTTGAKLTIIGEGKVEAIGGANAAGIGGRWGDAGGNIEICCGEVTARGGPQGAGIGGGMEGDGGVIKISGGKVKATGGGYGAGIGGGGGGNGGKIAVSGGDITATGGANGAGIGGGYFGESGEITISGSNTTVTAIGDGNAAHIGSGGVTVTGPPSSSATAAIFS